MIHRRIRPGDSIRICIKYTDFVFVIAGLSAIRPAMNAAMPEGIRVDFIFEIKKLLNSLVTLLRYS